MELFGLGMKLYVLHNPGQRQPGHGWDGGNELES